MTVLVAEPLSAAAFATYGAVIETEGAEGVAINAGTARRFADLAPVDVDAEGGRASLCIYRAQPRTLPLAIEMLERHPLSTQAFVPLHAQPFLVVVARAGDPPGADDVRAFVTSGAQGISFARGVWHHPLIALNRESDFLALERAGPDANCDECAIGGDLRVALV